MKYFVKLSVTIEAGAEIESRPGGPGPIVERLLERFKPEAVYFTINKRTMLMFVDLPDPADITELMVAGAGIFGAYPTFTPVISGDQFAEVISKALTGAKAINGD